MGSTKVRTNALTLANRLMSMIKKVADGDRDPDLKDGISTLAIQLGNTPIEISADLDDVSTKLAGEIGGSTIVQDPNWRGSVRVARRKKKKK